MDSAALLLLLLFLFLTTSLIAFRGLRKRMIKWRALLDGSKEKLRHSHLLTVSAFILCEVFVIALIIFLLPKAGINVIAAS